MQSWATAALLFVCSLACGKQAHATVCAIASGASEATIQTAATAASTGSCTGTVNSSTVQLAAGSYSWTSNWNMPCGTTAWTLTGPVVALTNMTVGGYPYYLVAPTAVITGSIGAGFGFSASTCSVGFTLQYFEWNGGRPSGGGGGFGYSHYGASNYTVQYIYAHGFQGVQYQSPKENEVFWYLDGCALNSCSSPPVASNVTFAWDRIGNSDAGDCSALMNEYQYVPDNTASSNFGGNLGGYCGTLGINSYTTNFVAKYNSWFHVEQAGKCYEAEGASPYYAFLHNNFLFQYNDLSQIHRIGFESQCSPVSPTAMTFDSNSIHDQFFGGYGSWPLSLPQSGGSPGANGGVTNTTNNVMMSNLTIPNVPSTYLNCVQYVANWGSGTSYAAGALVQYGQVGYTAKAASTGVTPGTNSTYWVPSGSGGVGCYSNTSTGGFFFPACIEFWGGGTGANNLCQSTIAGGIKSLAAPGCQTSTGKLNYNILQSTGYSGNIYTTPNEQCKTQAPPTITGNLTSTTVSARASAAPSIAVSGNTVTITSNGYTGSTTVGPLGNTAAYYTTDGSTPTINSTYCGQGSPACSFTAANGTIVNVIAMWGSLNQPRSYASGYGFVPSSVVTAQVSGGTTPTLTGVSLTLQDGTSTVQTGTSKQACANMTYSSGSPTIVCGSGSDAYGTTPGTWTSTAPTIAGIGTTGNVAGVAAGTTNLSVKAGSFTSPAFPLTVTAAAPVLQSITISCTNSIAVGQAGTCSCQGTYSGPTTGACPTTAYSSANTGTATVNSSSGALLGIAVGSTNITGTAGGFSSTVPLTVTSATPPAATITNIVVTCSPGYEFVGGTWQCHATANYSDGSQTDCTTTDAQGNLCSGWSSSSPSVATVNTTGLVSGIAPGTTNITVTSPSVATTASQFVVATPPSGTALGSNVYTTAGTTYPNYINATYAVSPTVVSTVSACTFYLPTGYTYSGKFDCGLIAAPTSTTQATSWLCHETYVTSGTSADVGWHTGTLSGCGNLAPSTPLWVALNTNISGPIGEGFSNCGGTCNGSAPTSGNGTFPCAFISATYGTYTGMGTAVTSGCGPAGTQASQYVTLTSPTPSLVGGYLTVPGLSVTQQIGSTIQFYAVCQYSDGTAYLCSPGPDVYGNQLTAITSSVPSVATIGAVGSANPGLLSAVSQGATSINGTLTGGIQTKQYGESITVNATPLPPVSPRQFSR